jgi:DNA-binding response OmpR family regulator
MNSPTRRNLLLADNSPDYRHSLRGFLELENYRVEEAESVAEAKRKIQAMPLDIALIDLRLTDDLDNDDISGLEVAKAAVEEGIPCLMITAFPSVETTRLALRSRGAEPLAEDYVPKANGPQAVLDAIHVVWSRQSERSTSVPSDLQIDLDRKLVWYKGEVLDLSRYQYALLAYLCRREGAVCSPEELLKEIYDDNSTPEQANADRRLERLVERVREKIEDDPSEPRHLLKVYGRGFYLDTGQ